MKRRPIAILPLASALGAIAGNSVAATPADAGMPPENTSVATPEAQGARALQPNTFISTGETLLGFVLTEQPDGTVVAQHVSHASHGHLTPRTHRITRAGSDRVSSKCHGRLLRCRAKSQCAQGCGVSAYWRGHLPARPSGRPVGVSAYRHLRAGQEDTHRSRVLADPVPRSGNR